MKSCFKHGYTYSVQGTLMGFVSAGFTICLLWFGGSLVIKGEIILEKVNFAYGIRENVLNDININIKPGEKIALVGESMPLNYETFLEEKGSNLSGGQRQRLSIARVLLKKSEILIMDKGSMIEEGSHRELLDKKGYYYRLWSEQSLDEEEKISV